MLNLGSVHAPSNAHLNMHMGHVLADASSYITNKETTIL